MKTINNKNTLAVLLIPALLFTSTLYSQRVGKITEGSVVRKIRLSDGPAGPIQGGESAVTDMILMRDGWSYGSTRATWGASNCHLFRTDGETKQHLINLTSSLPQQTAVTDICHGKGNTIIGCTSTYNEILDDNSHKYEGGHLFIFEPDGKKLKDLGIIREHQGINCIVADTSRNRIFGVTCPDCHLFCYDMRSGSVRDYGEVMKPWRVKDLGRVSWRGVPKVLILDDAGTIYFSSYFNQETALTEKEVMNGGSTIYTTYTGGLIYRLGAGDDKPVFTGATIPVQKGMDSDPLYENGIASAIRARDGGFWCGTINDGFLFKLHPSTSTVINKGKAFQYWNLKSLAWGGDGRLYMLGGRDEDNSWILRYDPASGSIECLGWPDNTAQCSVLCTDTKGRILIAENLRHSYIWVYEPAVPAR